MLNRRSIGTLADDFQRDKRITLETCTLDVKSIRFLNVSKGIESRKNLSNNGILTCLKGMFISISLSL